MCSMIVAVHLPRLALLVALLQARRPFDAPVALGPAPGAPQVVGLCTPAAEAQGVRPGLRIGEALARCPLLDLVVADPDAAAEAFERTLERLEAVGLRGGADRPRRRGVRRPGHPAPARGAHGGDAPRARRAAGRRGRAGRRGAHPVRRPPGRPRGGPRAPARARRGGGARLPRPPPRRRGSPWRPSWSRRCTTWASTPWARWPRCPARPPSSGSGSPASPRGAWPGARPGAPRARASLRARCAPPSPSPSRSGPCPPSRPPRACCWARSPGRRAAAGRPCAPSRCARGWPTAGRGRASSPCARPRPTPTASPSPACRAWARSPRPVAELWIGGDASGAVAGHQLTAIPSPSEERRARTREAIHQVRAAQGLGSMLRAVEMEPWSRRPERRWALTPYEP